MKKIVMMLLVLMVMASYVYAGEETVGDYSAGMGTKLVRGLWNVISSPAEIPCTINSDVKDRPASGAFTGLGKGIAFMARRILVGVCEVGTFIIPMEPTLPPVCQETKPAVSSTVA